ncbi:aspartate/glutamate racemase family protein [Microbacterium sp. K24]|uniref:aspartate/glutamate racemase family protein n=1 Tax=Microbacterium sp. K24 TaxID=2305446 RepID=UPI00109D73A7|nr:aspartate/glutamate racemase family protein [Microbacterium sp. K24]
MKTIGVLGGMSWESSLEWYRLANERVHAALGGHHSARIILDSLDFAEIEELQARDEWDAAGALLADHARGLERAGADLIVLCTNTMHLVADTIQAAIGIPFLHIADTTAAAVLEAGVRRVGLLGTAFTMEKPFYRERLEQQGIDVLVPDAEDRAGVHAVIYDELVHGVIRPESRACYREVIERLVARGAEGIILGCTEIELLVSSDDAPVPVFPTTALHVDAALAAAGLAGGSRSRQQPDT